MVTSAAPRFFNPRLYSEPAANRIVRRVLLTILAVHSVFAVISGYRAIVQIHSVSVDLPSSTLAAGTTFDARITSYARTYTHLYVVLQQATRAETISVLRLPGNHLSVYDERIRRGVIHVVLTGDFLRQFREGPAVLRVIGTGASQFLRIPPPVVREYRVSIAGS